MDQRRNQKRNFKKYFETKMEHNIPYNIMQLNQCREKNIHFVKKRERSHS